jgi:hypothetical protein
MNDATWDEISGLNLPTNRTELVRRRIRLA